jgi:hypothetical protein
VFLILHSSHVDASNVHAVAHKITYVLEFVSCSTQCANDFSATFVNVVGSLLPL